MPASALSKAPPSPNRIPLRSVTAPAAVFVVVLLLWSMAARLWLSPGPAQLVAALAQLLVTGDLLHSVATSLARGVPGFLLAVLAGTGLGLAMTTFPWLRRAFAPYLMCLLTLPTVAWVPLAILFFGVTDATVYFVVLTGAVPAVVNGLLAGVDQIQPLHLRVGQVLGASRLEAAVHVVLPAALPGYVAGLRQGWAFSWRALMAAEIISGGQSLGLGLGTLLQRGREQDDVGGVLAAITLILLVGLMVEVFVFAPLERRVLARRGLLERDTS